MNTLIIVSEDNMVIVDGFALNIELSQFNLPDDLWAVQFSNGKGHKEFKGSKPNKTIESISDFQKIIDAHAAMRFEIENPPPPTAEELAEIERGWRNNEIALTDRVFVADFGPVEWTEADRTAAHETIMGYRRELKQWPDQPEFPNSDYRPAWPEDVPRPAV